MAADRVSADLTCPTCKGETAIPHEEYGYLVHCFNCTWGRRRPELHEWDALKAERDRLAAKVTAVLDLVTNEDWHVGGVWGDYGEVVLIARNVVEAVGADYVRTREDRTADFAANVAEAQEAAELAEAERDRAKEAVRNLDKALRNAVKERGDALDERDRYHRALDAIAFGLHDRPDLVARAALDSDPALAERTRRIRADE